MQDKYVGDIGDFGKYALLNALCCGRSGTPPFKLGVVWYLVAGDERPDGKFIQYLTSSSKSHTRLRACDKALHEKLGDIVHRDERCVARVARDRVLHSAQAFVSETPPSVAMERRVWLDGALSQIVGCDVVFLDPDNGLRVELDAGRSRSQKHAYLDEVRGFAEGGRTVVVYHHLARQGSGQEQIATWRRRLDDMLGRPVEPLALWYHRGTARVYFVLPAPEHEQDIRSRVGSFVSSPWGQGANAHFTLE